METIKKLSKHEHKHSRSLPPAIYMKVFLISILICSITVPIGGSSASRSLTQYAVCCAPNAPPSEQYACKILADSLSAALNATVIFDRNYCKGSWREHESLYNYKGIKQRVSLMCNYKRCENGTLMV